MKKSLEIEDREGKKRFLISIVGAIIFHFVLIIVLSFFPNFKIKQEDKIPVVQVRLRDKITEEFEKLGEKEKEKIVKEQKKVEERIKKQIKTETKQIEKKKDKESKKTKDTIKDDTNNKIKSEETTENQDKIENVNNDTDEHIIKESDIFEEYNKKLKESEKKKEKDFFVDGDTKEESRNTNDNDNLEDIDKFLKDFGNDKGNDTKNSKGENDGKKNENISWDGGTVRNVLSFPKIVPSDDIAKSGQKITIIIKFSVNEDGNIISATVVESTGNPKWDIDIVNQLKRAKFEKRVGVTSIGKVEIVIDY